MFQVNYKMIKTQLYPHQLEAVEKLSKVKVGALFMDMGTGKTLTALRLFELKREKGKVDKLVFLCPVSTRPNLIDEVKKHTDYVYKNDYYVYGIDSISQSERIFLKLLDLVDERTFLVLDESTYIKNPHAIRTKRALMLSQRTPYKLIMTGTPITKFVKDLWAQMTFLSPLILGYRTYYSFAANHLEYDKVTHKIRRSCNEDYLSQKMSPYVFEKDITDITDMPKQFHITINYWLNRKKEEEYIAIQDEIFEKYANYESKDAVVYQLFTELQKCVSFDQDRILVLKETLDQIDPNKQVIIWCKYKKEIEMISKIVDNYAIFDGERKEEQDFKSGKKRILIANLQTGSHAQNFQNCHYEIFYSNSFDYATREQAERRIWRTGQENPCFYYDIKSNTGIEKIIFECLHRKENLVDYFLHLTKRFNQKYLEEYLRKELQNENIPREECT